MDSAIIQGAVVGGAVYFGLMQLKPAFMYTSGGTLKDEMKSPLNAALLAAAVFIVVRVYVQGAPLLPDVTGSRFRAATFNPASNVAGVFASGAGLGASDTFYE